LSFRFISDGRRQREQLGDLDGQPDGYRLYEDTYSLRSDSSEMYNAHLLGVLKNDHRDLALQQNKLARIIRAVTTSGLLISAANIAVIAESDAVSSRVLLGVATTLSGGLVFYIRSTLLPHNRELLAERRELRRSATAHAEREKKIKELRSVLAAPDHFRAAWDIVERKELPASELPGSTGTVSS
jgi:hypothetical protein